jgi:hypothetical protein
MKTKKNTPKRNLFNLLGALLILAGAGLNQGCAVIAGGSNYYAHVLVEDHPSAEIKYKGEVKGYGNATIIVPRKEANKLTFTISEDGCPTVERRYTGRVFRGWSFVGTLVTWTGLTINGGPFIPIPFGVIVDGITGSWWKPNEFEAGVSKSDYKNYNYNIKYKECDN